MLVREAARVGRRWRPLRAADATGLRPRRLFGRTPARRRPRPSSEVCRCGPRAGVDPAAGRGRASRSTTARPACSSALPRRPRPGSARMPRPTGADGPVREPLGAALHGGARATAAPAPSPALAGALRLRASAADHVAGPAPLPRRSGAGALRRHRGPRDTAAGPAAERRLRTVLGIAGHAVGWPLARGGSGNISHARWSPTCARWRRTSSPARRSTSLDELPTARAVLLDLTPRQILRSAGARLPPRLSSATAAVSVWARHLQGRLGARRRRSPGRHRLRPRGNRPPRRDAGGDRSRSGGGLGWPRSAERPFVLLAQPTPVRPLAGARGKHTAWAYCHLPNGSDVDMTEQIEAQIERFAPGFRERIIARHAMGPADLERHNPNLVGGRHQRRRSDAAPAVLPPGPAPSPLRHADSARVHLLSLHTARGACTACAATTRPGCPETLLLTISGAPRIIVWSGVCRSAARPRPAG